MDLTKRLGFSQDLLQSAANLLGEKKMVHPNQKEISQAAPPKDEITADDFKALKAKKKKFKVEGVDRKGKAYESPIFEDENDAVAFARKIQYSGALKSINITSQEIEEDVAVEAILAAVVESKEVNDTNASAAREHDCAKHVVHEEWGMGQTIPTMHAEPDAEGNIAWYDVMFEHGIEQQVATTNLNVTLSEKHKHKFMKEAEVETKSKTPKKVKNSQVEMNPVHPKPVKEDVEAIDEGRNADPHSSYARAHDLHKEFAAATGGKGRLDSYFHVNPKGKYRKELESVVNTHKGSKASAAPAGSNKAPADDYDGDAEANQHPIHKLRSIMDRNGGNFMGHKLTRGHAAKLITQHDALKPSQRLGFVSDIAKHVKNVVS